MSLSRIDTAATITLKLVPSTERDITSVELAGWMRESLGELSGIQSLSFDASGPELDIRVTPEGAALGLGYVAVLLMIYAALAVPLRSYGQPLIIMAVIPFGIVVNDSLVLVDHINDRMRSQGEEWREAVVPGGVRRFRPVLLTSVTTFMGLLPIQMETSIQAKFVKPMAISVGFGVLFAALVALFLVPV
jgi:multidrug efflux pump subunit AcrB